MTSNNDNKLTIIELTKLLNVSKPTVYSRAKALKIDLSGSYTDDEIERLKQSRRAKNSKVNKRKVKLSKDANFTHNFTEKNSLEKALRDQIKQLNAQLKVKDAQIKDANQLADQAQKLQADLQAKLNNSNQRLIELESKASRGFWYNLFHG